MITEITREKFQLGRQLANIAKPEAIQRWDECEVQIHGVSILWKCREQNREFEFLKEIQSYFGKASCSVQKQRSIQVFWHRPEDFGFNQELWEDSDPECRFDEFSGRRVVVQRDFIALTNEDFLFTKSASIDLVCAPELDDGVHNFLRWLLPLYLLEQRKLLLHSSAVSLNKRTAHVSLGVSGAGKTTISLMAGEENVLGDDMNVVSVKDHVFVESAMVGQAIQNREFFEGCFRVENFFILEKAENNQRCPIDEVQGFLALSTSVANLPWQDLSQRQTDSLVSLIYEIIQKVQVSRLKFNLDGGVWKNVINEKL